MGPGGGGGGGGELERKWKWQFKNLLPTEEEAGSVCFLSMMCAGVGERDGGVENGM